jgi:hypothetical protein
VSACDGSLVHLITRITRAATREYSSEDLSSVGLDTRERLQKRCSLLITASARTYRTASDFVRSNPHFFTDLRPSQVQKTISAERKAKLLDHPAAESWSQEAIRKRFLEALFPEPEPGSSNLFTIAQSPVLNALIKEIIDEYKHVYVRVTLPEDLASLEEIRKAGLEMSTLVYDYLRAWLCWGLHGPALAETMMILGPEVVRRRLEKGMLIWVDENALDPDQDQGRVDGSEGKVEAAIVKANA